MNLIIRPIAPRTPKTEKEIEEEQRRTMEINKENVELNEAK